MTGPLSANLTKARSALSVNYMEASAHALVSIAESLHVLAVASLGKNGVCVDCGHEWAAHAITHPKGCQATVSDRGVPSTCVCTEPRPTP